MANRIVGNVYIVDSQSGAGLSWLENAYIEAIHFYSGDTTGELKLVFTSNTANAFCHIRNNQNQPFNFPYYFGGVRASQLTPIVVTNGTGFIYFR